MSTNRNVENMNGVILKFSFTQQRDLHQLQYLCSQVSK